MSTNTKLAEAKAHAGEPVVPYLYVYEYDSPFGLNREFYPSGWNGQKPTRTVPLYTTPQPAQAERVGLTDEQIKAMYREFMWYEIDHFTWGAAEQVVRAIERAHGIGGTKESSKEAAVPEGMRLVPVEPTPKMVNAGREFEHPKNVWAAMLAAAPTPPAPEAQQPAGQEQDERAAFEAWARTYSTLPITHDAMFPHSYEDMVQAMLWDAWQARAALAQRREPLTASQVNELCNECHLDWHRGWSLDEEPNRYLELARAIERAHGIGATTGKEPGNV